MKRLVQLFGKALGVRFCPDNHVVPVLRLARYHRIEGAGFFWINPWLVETLAPVSIGLRVANFRFEEVLSQDNIPFIVNMTVLYQFDPSLPAPKTLAQLVRQPAEVLQNIVEDYASQGLRRLAATSNGESLTDSTTMSNIERDLTHYLRAKLRALGLMPLRSSGVLIKETIPPEKFKLAMLAAKQHQIILQTLGNHYEGELVEQAIRAQFLAGLETNGGNVTLWSSLDSSGMTPPYLIDPLERPLPHQPIEKPRVSNGPDRQRPQLSS